MCGIIGIYNFENKDINEEIIEMMKKLQHRGKDSFGISYIDKTGNVFSYKQKGMVSDFTLNLKDIISCVGHLKYRTSNMSKNTIDSQPIIGNKITISHNGNIPNVDGFDTQHIFDMIVNYNGSFKNSLINLIKTIPAAYSLVIQKESKVYILKDRYGIRPLSYGFKGNNIYISSETIGLEYCNNISEVESGQIIEIDNKGIREIYRDKNTWDNICAFEFIYFMNPHSFYKDITIESIRKLLVNKLVDKETIKFSKNDIVVGVPNSGILYAEEFSVLLGLKYEQVITKNTNERTFISSNKKQIEKTCHKKFFFNKDNINGKNIIVVDDTIVRGNVMGYICNNLKECGAKEIHIRIPSPPVIDICQLGIPINSKDELIMTNKDIGEIINIFGVNSLSFLEKDDLNEIPFDTYRECFGCGIKKEILSYLKN